MKMINEPVYSGESDTVITAVTNNKTYSVQLLLLSAVVVAATSQHVLSKSVSLATIDFRLVVTKAVLSGAVVALLSYLPMKYIYLADGYCGATESNNAVNIAMLLGSVTAYLIALEIDMCVLTVSAIAVSMFVVYQFFWPTMTAAAVSLVGAD